MRPASHFDVQPRVFPDQQTETSALPKLMLEVHPQVGFAPLRVNVRAQLQNVSQSNPFFGCMWESWHFGDGAVSSEKSDCEAAEVDLSFSKEHVYTKPGVYLVQFVLGETQLLSNAVSIRVLGN
jgi:hypothetical protein